LVGVNS